MAASAHRRASSLLFSLLLLALASLAPAAVRADPEYCARLPAGSASAIPHGFSAEEWADQLAAAVADSPEDAPVLCTPPPNAGDYSISNPVPEVNMGVLAYTARDYERWDSFDLAEDLLCVPTKFADAKENEASRVWGIGNGKTNSRPTLVVHPDVPLSASASAAATLGQPLTPALYLRAFQTTIENTYLPRGYSWFRGFARNPTLDWIETFKSQGRMDLNNALMNASFALNENYNIFRKAKKAAIQTRIVNELRGQGIDPYTRPIETLVDSEFDALKINWATDIARVQPTMDWYERYIAQVMTKQCQTPGTMVPRNPSNPTGEQYDAFGLFEGMDGPGFSQSLSFFYAHDYAFLAGHYLKLMRSTMIRKIRRSMYMQLAGQYASYIYRLPYEDRLSNQWLLRVSGFTTTAYAILRSESILKARGEWVASDGFTATDWTKGEVTNADLLAHCHKFLDGWVDRLEGWGLTESLSTYYGYVFDILTESMLHAPSQYSYNRFEQAWKMYYFDMASNWMPGAAAFSGAAGRHYDITTGTHSKADLWDVPIYLQMLYAPHCALQQKRLKWDGTTNDQVINLCTAASPTMIAPNIGVDGRDFNMARISHTMAQASGKFGYMPFDAFVNITFGAPYRTAVALTSDNKGQERFNWITPLLSLGFGAEEPNGIGTANIVVGRLAGVPKAGSSVAQIKQYEPTRNHAYLRLMPENADNPFYRASAWGVVSHMQPIMGRYVNVQHQGFMLTTSLLAGNTHNNGADAAWPHNTDLIIPITIDAIYADDFALPMTVGTVIALPPSTVFIARHGDASFAIRVLRLDVNSGIKHATQRTVISDTARYAPKQGNQEYSMTWQVDAASAAAGCGRVTIHHKHSSDTRQRAWRVATLWGAGKTRTDAEMWSLQRSIRRAQWTETLSLENGWNADDQPWSGPPAAAWNGWSPMGQAVWNTEVQIGSLLHLRVARTDVYQPSRGNTAYQHRTVPLNVGPYYLQSFERRAQGVEIFDKYFNGAMGSGVTEATNPGWQGNAMQYEKTEESAVMQPHISEPVKCDPAVDSPCFQWRASAWSACSATCREGTQTRTAKCVDASKSDAAAADSMCSATAGSNSKPALTQSCNLGPCVPGAPTMRTVQAKDGFVSVSWEAPADDGGAPIIRYVAMSNPADVATSAPASPMLVGPLSNGVAYTIRVAAVNVAGTGPSSAASASVTPDVYRWVYSNWGVCSTPCNGGQQSRTVSCKGDNVGPVSDAICLTNSAKPTDLQQACHPEPCVWSASAWSTCSKVCSGGVETRTVKCTSGVQPWESSVTDVASTWCAASTAPTTSAACNTQACAWKIGEWTTCSKACGSGTQTRSVTCTNGLGADQPAATCTGSIGSAPATTQACNTVACLPNQWTKSAWSTCSQVCGGGTQTRTIGCQSPTGTPLDVADCPQASKPVSQQACATTACIWRTGEYGACSEPCNGGIHTRTVECAASVGVVVPSSRCLTTAPISQESCMTQSCEWVTSPFNSCSASCGTGVQVRSATCSDGSKSIDDAKCLTPMPATSQSCDSGVVCIRLPSAPVLTRVEVGDSKAIVHFEKSADDGGETPGYIVEVHAGQSTPIASAFADYTGSDSGSVSPVPAAFTSYDLGSPITVGGLVNGLRYQFTVSAINSAGSGLPSTPSDEVSPFPPPGAPRLVAVSRTLIVDELLVEFEPATLTTSEPAATYWVGVLPADIAPVSGSSSPILLEGLAGNTNYSIVLWASNPSGESEETVSESMFKPLSITDAVRHNVGSSTDTVAPTEPMQPGGSGFISLLVILPVLALLLVAAFFGRRWYLQRKARIESSSTEPSQVRGRADAGGEEAEESPPVPHADLQSESMILSSLPKKDLRVPLKPVERRRPSQVHIRINSVHAVGGFQPIHSSPEPSPSASPLPEESPQPSVAGLHSALSPLASPSLALGSPSAVESSPGAGPPKRGPPPLPPSVAVPWANAPYHLRPTAVTSIASGGGNGNGNSARGSPELTPMGPSPLMQASPSPSPTPDYSGSHVPYVRPQYAAATGQQQQQ